MKKLLGSMLLALGLGLVFQAAEAIDASSKIICGTNDANQIYCTNYAGLEHGVWERIPGELKQVVVRAGQLWGVNVLGDIYFAADIRHPAWVHLNGKAKEIAESGGLVCIVNNADEIWCADANEGAATGNPGWKRAPGGARLKFISIN